MTDRDALELLFAMLAGSGRGWHAVEYFEDGRREWCWLRAGQPRVPLRRPVSDAFVSTLERLAWEREPMLTPTPCVHHGRHLPLALPTVLWARCETRDSERRLGRFQPEPTLILREGASCRVTAFWALQKPLNLDHAERANRRLSMALETRRKHAELGFRFHPPGTVLRSGRSRPVAVVVAGGSEEAYPAGLVVGDDARRRARFPKLRDAPDPDAWRKVATA